MHDYPKTRAAEARAQRESFAPYVYVALAVAVVCILVAALVVVLSSNPATGAADQAAVVSPPSAEPGPPVYVGGAPAGQQTDPTLAGLACGATR